ncbi:MAG: PEGA domain-containing protein [Kofleriaceae bacterium]|nr:PEGA domain-containing protein [Myxococcales bacterium]MCB9573770.1 PEGA domain-containing protein [Kofleriaceae bacterium]
MRRIAIATLCAALISGGMATRAQPAFGDGEGGPAPDVAPDDGPGPEEALTQKIAVWRLDALGLDAELVARLEALFRSELDRLAKHPLPSRRDMDEAVGKDRKLRDCTGEDKCLTSIGQKIGVDVMVTGQIAALGDSYILNIKAVDVKTGKQLRRIATDPLRGSPDELIEAVRVAAYSLLAPEQLYGSIVVLSDMVGATVTLDGKVVGKTPLTKPLTRQVLGDHTLRVEADGYLPFEEPVEVHFQKSSRVVVRLAAEAAVVDPGDGAPKVVVRGAPHPWYTSKWTYIGAGVAALTLGAIIGWGLGKDDVVSCIPPDVDPRCGGTP